MKTKYILFTSLFFILFLLFNTSFAQQNKTLGHLHLITSATEGEVRLRNGVTIPYFDQDFAGKGLHQNDFVSFNIVMINNTLLASNLEKQITNPSLVNLFSGIETIESLDDPLIVAFINSSEYSSLSADVKQELEIRHGNVYVAHYSNVNLKLLIIPFKQHSFTQYAYLTCITHVKVTGNTSRYKFYNMICEIENNSAETIKVSFKSMNQSLHYSFYQYPDGICSDLMLGIPIPQDELLIDGIPPVMIGLKPKCTELDFLACFVCGWQECMSEVLCGLACGSTPLGWIACSIGFAIGCLIGG